MVSLMGAKSSKALRERERVSFAFAILRKSTMAESATQENSSDCTKPKQLWIAKLKLPTLAAGNLKNQVKQSQGIVGQFIELRSEADNAPPLLAALFSNKSVRIPGFSGSQRSSIQHIQKPGFIPNNPLGMLTGLFSEIKEELATEARKFSLIQEEYFKECVKRSRSPRISRSIRPPETANTASSQVKDNDLSFLVRLFFEIMQGPEDIKVKGACEMPSLPDIYSIKESQAACETPSLLPANSVKQLTDAASYENSAPISGFHGLFSINRK